MATYYKSQPKEYWQTVDYYKLNGSNVIALSGNNLELKDNEKLQIIAKNEPLIEIQQKEFDNEYIKFITRLNFISNA